MENYEGSFYLKKMQIRVLIYSMHTRPVFRELVYS